MPKEVPTFRPQGFSQTNLTSFSPVNVQDNNAFSQVFQVAGAVSNRMFDAAFNIAKKKTVAKAQKQATTDVLSGNIDASQLDETNITIANQAYMQRAGSLMASNLMLDFQRQNTKVAFANKGNPEAYTAAIQEYVQESVKGLPSAVQANYITNANRQILFQADSLNRSRISQAQKQQNEELKFTKQSIFANIPRIVATDDPALVTTNAEALKATLEAENAGPAQVDFMVDKYYHDAKVESLKQRISRTDTTGMVDELDAIRDEFDKGEYPNLTPSDIDDLRDYGRQSFGSRESAENLKTREEKAQEERESIFSNVAAIDYAKGNPSASEEDVVAQAQVLYPDNLALQNDFIAKTVSEQIKLAARAEQADIEIDPMTDKGQKTLGQMVLQSGSPDEAVVRYEKLSTKFGSELPGVFSQSVKALSLTTDPKEAERIVSTVEALASEHPSVMRSLSTKDQATVNFIHTAREQGLSHPEVARRIMEGGVVPEEQVAKVRNSQEVKDAASKYKSLTMQNKFRDMAEANFRMSGDIDLSIEQADKLIKNQFQTQKIKLGKDEQEFGIVDAPQQFEKLKKDKHFQPRLAQVITQQISANPITRAQLDGKSIGESVKINEIVPMEGQSPSVLASGNGRYVVKMMVNGQLLTQDNVSLAGAVDPEYYLDQKRIEVKAEHERTATRTKPSLMRNAPKTINMKDPVGLNNRAQASGVKVETLLFEAESLMRPVLLTNVQFADSRVASRKHKMHEKVAPHFESFAGEFKQLSGTRLPLASLYRNHHHNRAAGGATYSAHQFGTSFDVNMDGNKFTSTLLGGKMNRSQLVKLARKHGFAPIVKGDPNHFTYVGK